jgi:pilus assembly protein FimV
VAVERPGPEEAWTGGEGDEPTLTRVMETPEAEGDETAEVPLDDSLRLDDLTDGVDLEFGDEDVAEDDATQLAPTLAADDVDEDDDTQEMPPVTMSEIGTKLDLARAYIDMGDPDGAKSILEEVLAEGDDAQKTEARELIESLG